MSLLAVAAAGAVLAGAALQSPVGFGFALVAAPLAVTPPRPRRTGGRADDPARARGQPADAPDRAAPARAGVARCVAVVGVVAAGRARRRRAAARARRAGAAARSSRPACSRRSRSTCAPRTARRARRGASRSAGRGPPPGSSSGALNTSTSTGGPPVVLLLISRGLPPGRVRDTLTAAFIGFAVITAPALVPTSTGDAVPTAARLAALVPVTAAGTRRGAAGLRAARAQGAPTSACSPSCCSRRVAGLATVRCVSRRTL